MVLYEYPFNEGIRTMLRLEHLFDRLGQLVPRDAPVDHHFALATLVVNTIRGILKVVAVKAPNHEEACTQLYSCLLYTSRCV